MKTEIAEFLSKCEAYHSAGGPFSESTIKADLEIRRRMGNNSYQNKRQFYLDHLIEVSKSLSDCLDALKHDTDNALLDKCHRCLKQVNNLELFVRES